MIRINNFQIYCMLVLVTVPTAFLITPAIVTHTVNNSAWLAVLAGSLPAALISGIYIYILKKSPRPFPAMMEDCLGKAVSKVVGFLYILVYLLSVAVTLRIFVTFISSNVVPDTPLSIFIGCMLLTGYYGLKTGLENIARVAELLILFGVPLSFIILLISLIHFPGLQNLLPLACLSCKTFIYGTFEGFIVISNMAAILVLAYFSDNREKVPRILLYVSVTYIALIGLTSMLTIMHFGTEYTNLLAFPTFKIVRGITIGDFIQNIDAAFIALWITGIFGSLSLNWFMACYITQQVFNLRDYRFIAAPTSIIIGVLTLKIGQNIIETQTIITKLLPLMYSFFYIFIPFLIFMILLFKHSPGTRDANVLKTPSV